MQVESLEALERRLRAMLPETYQDTYEDVRPVSMGSAGLKFDAEGRVAWDKIWGSFCDLAMAGGPPHKGKLLEPGSRVEIEAAPDAYQDVVDEICRGIALASGLYAKPSAEPGWVEIDCASHGMAGWLARAIVMENVSARCRGPMLDLPAGPKYRLAKEIKNVVTSVAKTCHYWQGHMGPEQHREIANLFARENAIAPLLQPALSGGPGEPTAELSERIARTIRSATGLIPVQSGYMGWLGVDCGSVHAAIWLMRALVVSNVLARREETVLFVPVNPEIDASGDRVASATAQAYEFARMRKVL